MAGQKKKGAPEGLLAVAVYFLQEQHATMNLLDFKTTDVQLSTSIIKWYIWYVADISALHCMKCTLGFVWRQLMLGHLKWQLCMPTTQWQMEKEWKGWNSKCCMKVLADECPAKARYIFSFTSRTVAETCYLHFLQAWIPWKEFRSYISWRSSLLALQDASALILS